MSCITSFNLSLCIRPIYQRKLDRVCVLYRPIVRGNDRSRRPSTNLTGMAQRGSPGVSNANVNEPTTLGRALLTPETSLRRPGTGRRLPPIPTGSRPFCLTDSKLSMPVLLRQDARPSATVRDTEGQRTRTRPQELAGARGSNRPGLSVLSSARSLAGHSNPLRSEHASTDGDGRSSEGSVGGCDVRIC